MLGVVVLAACADGPANSSPSPSAARVSPTVPGAPSAAGTAGAETVPRPSVTSLAPTGAPPAVPGTSTAGPEPSGSAPVTPVISVAPTVASTSPGTVPAVPVYVFPFTGRDVSFGDTHHDYPAIDVFGCGATVVAPTSGVIVEVSLEDRWDPAVNDPATRGGKFVSLDGDDRVRYYVAHLDSVAVAVGQRVTPGTPLGVMGQTGNARNSACHTHVGFSWMCPSAEWQVRRGKVWPQDFLRAWRDGRQDSPADAVALSQLADPDACAEAAALMPPSP